MGIELRNRLPIPLTPEQQALQEKLQASLGPQPDSLESITALPGETDQTDQTYMPPEPMQPPALPEGAKPISPSSTPGTTEAVKTAEESKSEETPDIDADGIRSAFETPMPSSEEEEPSDDEELSKAEADTQFATGIGGAIQAFGEGLASITGGSAKGLQTGVRAYQEVAARKEASLRDRIRAKRQKESDEFKYRDAIEDRQKKQRLKDPASEESAAARQEAGLLMDTMIAQFRDQGAGSDTLDKLEEVKAVMSSGNVSAEQIANLQSKLKDMGLGKPKESVESAQARKAELQETAWGRQQQRDADKQFQKDMDSIGTAVQNSNKLLKQLIEFKANYEKAKNNDPEAKAYLKQYTNTINYLLAREKEPKGVFTDNDLRALSQFDTRKTFEQQAQSYYDEKFAGELDPETLNRIGRALENAIPTLEDSKRNIIESKRRIYLKSKNPALRDYGNEMSPDLFGNVESAPAQSQTAQPQTAQPQTAQPQTAQPQTAQPKNNTKEEINRAKEGDTLYVKGKAYRKQGQQLVPIE